MWVTTPGRAATTRKGQGQEQEQRRQVANKTVGACKCLRGRAIAADGESSRVRRSGGPPLGPRVLGGPSQRQGSGRVGACLGPGESIWSGAAEQMKSSPFFGSLGASAALPSAARGGDVLDPPSEEATLNAARRVRSGWPREVTDAQAPPLALVLNKQVVKVARLEEKRRLATSLHLNDEHTLRPRSRRYLGRVGHDHMRRRVVHMATGKAPPSIRPRGSTGLPRSVGRALGGGGRGRKRSTLESSQKFFHASRPARDVWKERRWAMSRSD